MTLKTVLNKVIVEPVEAETVTKGGIIIPDTAQKKYDRKEEEERKCKSLKNRGKMIKDKK